MMSLRNKIYEVNIISSFRKKHHLHSKHHFLRGEFMGKFKINKIEKFFMRHKKACLISYLIFIFALAVAPTPERYWDLESNIITVIFFVYAFFILNNMFKVNKLMRIYRKRLELNVCLDGANQFINAVNPKNITDITTWCNNRIAFLLDLGETEKAEEEIRLFWQTFNPNKLPLPVLVAIHENMAEIKIRKGDAKGYNEQLRLLNDYRAKAKGFAKFSISVDAPLSKLLLMGEATFGNFTEDFESRVFAELHTFRGKTRKRPPCPLHFLSAYDTLFIYFKRFNLPDKAKYYAEMIMKIGNEQFFAYREAREYLEKH